MRKIKENTIIVERQLRITNLDKMIKSKISKQISQYLESISNSKNQILTLVDRSLNLPPVQTYDDMKKS